jgi:hypothetical protein
VLSVTDEGVQALHKLNVGAVAVAVSPHQSQHTQSTIKLTLHSQLVLHQYNHAQVQVQGQLHSIVLAVVPFAHKLSVGIVFELVQFAAQHTQFTFKLHSFQFIWYSEPQLFSLYFSFAHLVQLHQVGQDGSVKVVQSSQV